MFAGFTKKPLFMGLAAAGVVVVGAAIYYFGYYANPSVVYSQSLKNTGKGYEKLVDYLDAESKLNYKGATGEGSYKLGSGGFATDGKLSFRNNGSDSDFTLDVNAGASRVNFEALSVKPKTTTAPNYYFKFSGLNSIGSLLASADPTATALVTKYDGQWIMFDQALLDKLQSAAGAGGTNASNMTSPTHDQLSDEEHAFGRVNQQYLFSTKKDKALLKVVKKLGSETVDGHKTYHYQVGLDKANFKKYLTAQRDALKASKLDAWLKANNYENYVDLAYDSLEQSADSIKSSDTFELWADKSHHMIYKVRFADQKDPTNSYSDLGVDYKGGSSYPFFVNFYSKTGGDTTSGSFVVTLDSKQHDVSFKADAKSTGASSFNLSANFLLKPTNDVKPITAPADSIPLSQLLNDLGLGAYLNDLQSPTTPSSGSVQSKSQDSKRQTDIRSIQTQLEAYFAQYGYYPSLADMNSSAWLSAHMKSLDRTALQDPSGSSKTLAAKPAAGVYAYQPTAANGASCEADDQQCAAYTLTATLSTGSAFTEKNLD